MEKLLLNINELCEYTGFGKTKMREILKRNEGNFVVQMGNRLFANKKKFDEWIDRCTKYQIKI